MQPDEFAQRLVVFRYRPEVLADQRIQVGLPWVTPAPLTSMLWYVRMDDTVRQLFGMEPLGDFLTRRGVPGVDFSGHSRFIDADLERLFQMDFARNARAGYRFRLLKLQGTQVTDRALATISKLRDLQVLELNGQITDQGLRHLATLGDLRAITLPSVDVTDASAPLWAAWPKLEILRLKNSSVSDTGLAAFKGQRLRQLETGPQVSDQGLRTLAAQKALEFLDVSQSRVTRLGLAHVPPHALHTLFLGPSFTDDDVAVLERFRHLKRLDMTQAKTSNQVFAVLEKAQGLEELALGGTRITKETVNALGKLKGLRYLDVAHTPITAEDFSPDKGFSSLEALSISSSRKLTLTDLQKLTALPKLHTVLINGMPVGRAMLDHLRRKPAGKSAWRWRWVREAEAAEVDDRSIEDALELASLPPNQTERPFRGLGGLRQIHAAESSLDEIVPAAAPTVKDPFAESADNFMGEFSVGVGSTKKKR